MHIPIYAHTYICTMCCIPIYAYAHAHTPYAYVYACIPICTHMHMHTLTYPYCICTHSLCICTHSHIHMHTLTYAYAHTPYAYAYACIPICICTHAYAHAHTCTCTCTCTHAYVFHIHCHSFTSQHIHTHKPNHCFACLASTLARDRPAPCCLPWCRPARAPCGHLGLPWCPVPLQACPIDMAMPACPIATIDIEFEFDEIPIEFAKHVDKRFTFYVTHSCLPRPWGGITCQ
jgi:hypothetical protein